MKIIILILIVSRLFPSSFITDIGECRLEYNNDNEKTNNSIQKIVSLAVREFKTEFGSVDFRPFTVHISNTIEDFNQRTHGHAPEWSIAMALGNPDRIVLQSPVVSKISWSRFEKLIVHELNHICFRRMNNSYSAPAWFSEGLAMRSSGEFSIIHKITLSRAVWKKILFPLSRIYNMHTLSTFGIKQAYAQSAAAVSAMVYYYDLTSLRMIFESMQNGLDFQDAFIQITGDDLLDFQEKYELFVRQNYRWMFLLRSSNLFFVLLPLILISGFVIKRKRNKFVRKQWENEEQLINLQSDLGENDVEI